MRPQPGRALLSSLLSKFGAGRLALMGGVALALLAGLGYLALPDRSGPMAYLYTDLEPAAAQAITDKLQASGVPFQLSADGTGVLAPQSRLAELRMTLAGDRLGGKVGYDILEEEQPFGVSASRARLNETRAIEGELARSIETLDSVSRARVHIVMPERALFASQARRATAAVTVKTVGRLPGESVQAIRNLVAASVPELSAEAISVIDQTGALLARSGEAGAMDGADADERQGAVEAKLRQQIESLLEPIVGAGKVRAEVAAEINRDQRREEASVVDPDRQAIAHQVTVESTDQADESNAAAQAASVSAQLPENKGEQPAGSGDSRRSSRGENSEDTTYENSRTNSVTVKGPGDIKRLTVAVMIDGGAQPLPPPQVQRLQRLVENAVGFNSERGDSVVVESMKFTAADLANQDEGFFSSLPTGDIFSLLKLVVLGAVGLLALRFLRPLIEARLLPAAADPSPALLPAETDGAPAPALPEPAQLHLAMQTAETRGALLDHEISLAEVDGRVKASAVKRIGDTVAASPGEATAVIRQWLNN